MQTVTPAGEPFRFTPSGLQLAGERWRAPAGPGSGPPLVLLHGGGQTRHSWDRSARRLAEGGHEVITLDARGHGDSAWDPDEDYSIDAFARDLEAFVTDMGTPPVLVGASLGGMTGLLVAGERPGLASAVVLVDVVVGIERAGVERIRSFMASNRDGFASLEEVARAVADYTPERSRPPNPEGLRKNVRLGEDGRWHWHWDPAFISIDDEPQRRADPERLADAARRLTVPTLIVRGGRSDVVSDRGIAEMRQLVPHAEVVDVSAAGHMVVGDDNDVFTVALDGFLSGAGLA